jgi:hypothetical protein
MQRLLQRLVVARVEGREERVDRRAGVRFARRRLLARSRRDSQNQNQNLNPEPRTLNPEP